MGVCRGEVHALRAIGVIAEKRRQESDIQDGSDSVCGSVTLPSFVLCNLHYVSSFEPLTCAHCYTVSETKSVPCLYLYILLVYYTSVSLSSSTHYSTKNEKKIHV